MRRFTFSITKTIPLLFAALSFSPMAWALNNGDVDNTFAGGLSLSTYEGLTPFVAIQADRKVVLCNTSISGSDRDIVVRRLLENGAADPTFNLGAPLLIDAKLNHWDDECAGVAIDRNGSIVIVGTSKSASTVVPDDIVLVRLTGNGSLDASFGVSGVATADFQGNFLRRNAAGLVLRADGFITIAATVITASGVRTAALGVLKGSGEWVHDLYLPDPFETASAIAADDDSNVYIAIQYSTVGLRSAVAKFRPGSAGYVGDFGTSGFAYMSIASSSTNELIKRLMVQRDQKVVAVGDLYQIEGTSKGFVKRLNTSGQPDLSFGDPTGNGSVVFENIAPVLLQRMNTIVQQGSCKLAIAGVAGLSGDVEVGFLRSLNRDGSRDNQVGSFPADVGLKLYNFALSSTPKQQLNSTTLQGTQYIGAGRVNTDTLSKDFVVRLYSDEIYGDGCQ